MYNLVLKESPNNPSVRKFVEFIENNAKKRTFLLTKLMIWFNKKNNTNLHTQAMTLSRKNKERGNRRRLAMRNKSLRNKANLKKKSKKKRSNSKNQRKK